MNELTTTTTTTNPEAIVEVVAEGGLTRDMVERAKLGVELAKEMKVAALAATNERDWIQHGEAAYLQESGTNKIAVVFGLSFKNTKTARYEENLEGKTVIRYIATVTVIMPMGNTTREIDMEGLASSDDPFFSERKNRKTGERFSLPLSEINLNNIAKKAVTNAMGRGARKILGLSNLTWAEVSAGTGMKKGTIAKVDYQKSKEARPSTGTERAGVREKIRGLCYDMEGGDDELARALCCKITSFKGRNDQQVPGKDWDGMTDNWAQSSLRKVREAWEKHNSSRSDSLDREPGKEG